ncbi:MAG: MFS transporter [Chloroflexi bacterium]|nr:MFS transporter [Chloroflexota bacterium]
MDDAETGGPAATAIPQTAATDAQAAQAAKTGVARRPAKVFYGWWIVTASALTNGLGGSIQWQGFTVFFLPVARTLGLSHAATSVPFALARAENGVLGPLTGWLIDRVGVRPLMLIGTVIVGIGYIGLSRTNSYLSFLLVYLFVISVGASTAFMQASTTAINHWFIRRRGLAMSINSAAFRLGGAIMIPLLAYLVLKIGWQTTSFWVGILMIVVVAPLALLFRQTPESMGLKPDGDSRPLPRAAAGISGKSGRLHGVEATTEDWGIKEALRTPAYWTLAAGTTLRIAVHGAVGVHMVPMLVSRGVTEQTAALMVGALAGVSVPLILAFGWLGDHVGRSKLLTIGYSMSGLSLLLLALVSGTWPLMAALLLFAGSEAGAALNWALVGDMFGRRNFATLRGMLAPVYNASLVVTPIAAGFVFDSLGTYGPALLAGGALMFAAAAVFFVLKAPKRPDSIGMS